MVTPTAMDFSTSLLALEIPFEEMFVDNDPVRCASPALLGLKYCYIDMFTHTLTHTHFTVSCMIENCALLNIRSLLISVFILLVIAVT